MSIAEKITRIKESLPEGVTLVAVSKTHPAEAVREAYDAGSAFSVKTARRRCATSTLSFRTTYSGI